VRVEQRPPVCHDTRLLVQLSQHQKTLTARTCCLLTRQSLVGILVTSDSRNYKPHILLSEKVAYDRRNCCTVVCRFVAVVRCVCDNAAVSLCQLVKVISRTLTVVTCTLSLTLHTLTLFLATFDCVLNRYVVIILN